MLSRKTGPWVFAGNCANDVFSTMVHTIRSDGNLASPRGLQTLEILHAVTRIENPRQRVLTQVGRKLNPFFNLAETLWILNGESEARWILFFNSQLHKYLDSPMTHFHGAYGERLRRWPRIKQAAAHLGQDIREEDQLVNCYHTLRNGAESRQAVMTLWSPKSDNYREQTLDRPCNLAVTFKVRYDQLWMSVFNRSNDVILGLTSTNIVQFSTLQESLAAWLGVEPGPYSHYSDSLHIYDSQAVSDGPVFDLYAYVDPTPMVPRTQPEFDENLRALYGQIGSVVRSGLVKAPTTEGLEALRVAKPFSECPYWNSVGWALLGYIFHKQKDPAGAVRCVARMTTADWQIECLRWLADRYGEDPLFQNEAGRIIGDLPLKVGGLEGRQAVWEYVFQSYSGNVLGSVPSV